MIFTDPEYAANVPDSETEGPQIINYVGKYCDNCITKLFWCICNPESNWDADHSYAGREQVDSPPNVGSDKYPIPSDWSDQEEFWDGRTSKKLPQDSGWDLSDTQEDKNDSNWNDNLDPYNYKGRSQPQKLSRQPLPGWPKGIRQQTPISHL